MGAEDANANRNLLSKSRDANSNMSPVPRNSYDGPFVMRLLPVPKMEQLKSKPSIVYTGSVSRAIIGPAIGAVDIGVGEFAYFFQVALPGVKKDQGGQFSCEVEHDGKVHICGITSTGGRTVERHSRVYQMKFPQQCPPGPFTLSFCLPGPVDPRFFQPNFRSDGILEAVVATYE